MLRAGLIAGSCFVVLAGHNAAAANLNVTDSMGTTTELRDVYLNYTPGCCGLVRVEKEYEGFRIRDETDRSRMVRWVDLKEVQIAGDDGVAVLRSGQRSQVALLNATLFGVSDLGEFSVPLGKVTSIVPITKSAVPPNPTFKAMDGVVLRIDGSETIERALRWVSVRRGDGVVSVTPSSIRELTVLNISNDLIQGELTLRNGKIVQVSFHREESIAGETSVVPLSRVKRIRFQDPSR